MEKAISLIEYQVKILKNKLNLENTVDRIKFLNEIAKLISKVDNNIEKEIYIEKIAKEYKISKEAIYAEVNKIAYASSQGSKILTKEKPVIKREIKQEEANISEEIIKRENTIISLLIDSEGNEIYQKIKDKLKPQDFKFELNKKIAEKIYEQFDKGNFNVNALIDNLEQELQNQITSIMSYDFGIEDKTKAAEDILTIYERERLNSRKIDILSSLETTQGEEKKGLEKELSDIIIKLAKFKHKH